MTTKADTTTHWQGVWQNSAPDTKSWYRETPDVSLALLAGAGLAPGMSVIDVGGGSSNLVDALLDRKLRRITVLDVSEAALAIARRRLDTRADEVDWVVADITAFTPAHAYDIWHDRAVFHFLTEPADRRRYLSALRTGLRPGGQLIIATFAPDGPERCSGLPVVRYDADTLAAFLGEGFVLEETRRETHRTPSGASQMFTWCRFLRTGDDA